MPRPDLDAYLQRIGYSGERAATLEVLRAIHGRHAQTIAFENLNPFLAWPVPLDLASLEQKMVHGGRGGYCFEQNQLLAHMLAGIGFKVRGLGARVLWNAPEGTVTARTHMLLAVDLAEGRYIADVGFGGQTPTAPLRLEPDIEQPTPHEPYRLVRAGEDYVLQTHVGRQWKPMYRFSLHEQLAPDYEVTNWYLANHPESRFVRNLVVARPAADRRYALLNREFAVHFLDGRSEQRTLASAAELRELLEEVFLLALPDSPELDAGLRKIVEA